MRTLDWRSGAVAAVAFVMLTGLSWPTTLHGPATAEAPAFAIVDARPPIQLKSGFESLLITNCAYGSVRIGDRDFSPGLATRLTDELASRFGSKLQGHALKLVNFTVHQNGSVGLRNTVSSMYGGAIDSLLNDHKVAGCAADDLRGGYVMAEVPPPAVPWVVVVDLEVDGHALHARWVQPVTVPDLPRGTSRADRKAAIQAARGADLDRAINAVLLRLDRQIAGVIGVEWTIPDPVMEASPVAAPLLPQSGTGPVQPPSTEGSGAPVPRGP